jgi:hypothetical protein
MAISKKQKRNERNSLEAFYKKRDKALERVVAAWEKSDAADFDIEIFNKALDELTIAHAAATFEWASGPHKW